METGDQNDDMEDDFDDEDSKVKEELKALNDRINFDEEDYDAHDSKIRLLKSIGELDDLRIARQKFADIFPLTDEMWLEWIKDEKNLVETEDDKKEIYKLFDRAVKDYVSVPLWLEYCQFSIGGINTREGIEKSRNIFERAISAVGIHVSRGALIWEAFREFENALLLLQSNSEGKAAQKERIDKLFCRQLSVPHLGKNIIIKEGYD